MANLKAIELELYRIVIEQHVIFDKKTFFKLIKSFEKMTIFLFK